MTPDLNQAATSAVRTIGRYRAFDELGRGAMGVVYRGFDPVIGRTVALKTLVLAGTDAAAKEFRDRLYREAAAAGALSHPGIVTIFDIVEDAGVTAVAMEYIEGRTLAAIIEEQAPLPLDYAIDIFEQLCSALDYAGAAGIVHRDIKPANILLTPAGRVKITDFGVARLALSTMTQAGTVLGSPSYMSPEQVRGLPLDGRSDLFSATVVFYEMITRERPFAGSDVATTMYRIAHEPPTPPSQFNVAIGPGLTALLERALAKDPNDRYRTGADLVAALRGVARLSSAGSAVHRPSQPRSTVTVTAAAASPAPESVSAGEPEVPTAEAIIAAASVPPATLAPLPGFEDTAGTTPKTGPPDARGHARAGVAASGADTSTKPARAKWLVIAGASAAVLILAASIVFLVRPGPEDTGGALTDQAGTSVGEAVPGGSAGSLDVPSVPPPVSVPAQSIPPPTGPIPPPPAPAKARRPSTASSPTTSPTPAVVPRAPVAPRDANRQTADQAPAGRRDRVYDASQVDQRPVVTREVAPTYPADALRRGVEDVVILKVVVLATGQVDEVQILRGSKKDPAFDTAAVAAVQQWRFSPARKGGAAVHCYFNVGVPFQMKK